MPFNAGQNANLSNEILIKKDHQTNLSNNILE